MALPDIASARAVRSYVATRERADEEQLLNTSHQRGCEGSVPAVLPSEDLFRHRGLGKCAWRIVHAVTRAGALSDSAVAEALRGMHASTIRRQLRRLEALGVIGRNSEGAWARTGVSLEEIAERVGTAGTLERQRALHEAQRIQFSEVAHRSARGGSHPRTWSGR